MILINQFAFVLKAVYLFAYENSTAATKSRYPEPVIRLDPVQGSNILYDLKKIVKNGRKVLFCFVKRT